MGDALLGGVVDVAAVCRCRCRRRRRRRRCPALAPEGKRPTDCSSSCYCCCSCHGRPRTQTRARTRTRETAAAAVCCCCPVSLLPRRPASLRARSRPAAPRLHFYPRAPWSGRRLAGLGQRAGRPCSTPAAPTQPKAPPWRPSPPSSPARATVLYGAQQGRSFPFAVSPPPRLDCHSTSSPSLLRHPRQASTGVAPTHCCTTVGASSPPPSLSSRALLLHYRPPPGRLTSSEPPPSDSRRPLARCPPAVPSATRVRPQHPSLRRLTPSIPPSFDTLAVPGHRFRESPTLLRFSLPRSSLHPRCFRREHLSLVAGRLSSLGFADWTPKSTQLPRSPTRQQTTW